VNGDGGPPEVSLILIGYNNERFVEEAINSAFAQNYPRLQIILSDDCSTDQTFEAMKQAAASYAGPHLVELNRTESNCGTVAHLYHAVRRAKGGLIVLAAADDISYPHRVNTLADTWRETGAQALFSSQDLIDESGRILERDHRYDDSSLEWNDYFPGACLIRGATSAYARSTFADVKQPTSRILFEDTFFTLMLHLAGKPIVFVDQPLVQYRVHDAAITNANFREQTSAQLIERERRTETYARSILAVLDAFERELGDKAPPARLASDRAFYEFRTRWMKASFSDRLAALARARRHQHRRWLLARHFGPNALAWLKAAANKVGRDHTSKASPA
jgi:glycosyltransferase involved in cell wall biosynthesis